MKTKTDNTKDKKDCRMAFRVTSEQKRTIEEKANECGLSVSEYVMFRALNCEPKRRMTDDEIKVYLTLADVMTSINHLKNALKGKTQEELMRYFRDADFMNWWIVETAKAVRKLHEILDSLSKQQ